MAIKINRSPKSNNDTLPGSVFYKEDMKRIFNTLKRRGPESEAKVIVEINGGEYEIDEVVDFDSDALDGKKFRDMKFEASHGKSLVVVELLPDSGQVSEMRDEDDVVMTGVSEKVQEIAKDREDHAKVIGSVSLLIFGMIPFYMLAARLLVGPIVAASSALGYPLTKEVLVEQEALGLILGLFYIPAVIFVLKKMRLKGNILVNSPKGKSRLFRDKLMENWQVSALWALVGAAMGAFLGRIFS